MGKSERQYAFGTGIDRNPFVRVRSCLRHTRLQLDEFGASTRVALPHFTETHVLRYRRIPRSEEVCSKREYIPRMSEIDGRKLFVAEATCIGASKDLLAEGFKFERRLSAKTAEKLRDQCLSLRSKRS